MKQQENTTAFLSKEVMLKNLKKNYQNHRMSYKQYMVESHYIEKHYDEMKEQHDNEENNTPTVSTDKPDTIYYLSADSSNTVIKKEDEK